MATDLQLLSNSVTDILGLSAKAAEQTATAAAQKLIVTGDTEEAKAYGSAADIATQNAALEAIAGKIAAVQEQRKAAGVIGTQRAAFAANGFSGKSLTSVLSLASSARQSSLAQQLNTIQTSLNVGGYEAKATASKAEQTAALAAASSAEVLGTAAEKASAISTANAANETKALEDLLSSSTTKLTTEQKAEQDVITSVLKSPLNEAVTLPDTLTSTADTTTSNNVFGNTVTALPTISSKLADYKAFHAGGG